MMRDFWTELNLYSVVKTSSLGTIPQAAKGQTTENLKICPYTYNWDSLTSPIVATQHCTEIYDQLLPHGVIDHPNNKKR